MKSKELESVISAAKAGGEVVRGYFGKVLQVEEKSGAEDYRTLADTESEKVILDILQKEFPTYNILSEECGMIDKKSEYTFYIDPLDGTNNFFIGIPNFSVSIALMRGNETILGVIYLPMVDAIYFSEKGKGAYYNDHRLTTPSIETDLARCTSSFLCGYGTDKALINDIVSELSIKTKRTLTNWSVASDICLLANGKIEIIVSLNNEPYDFLAAKLIVKEAGCTVVDFEGSPEKDDINPKFVACNNKTNLAKVLAFPSLQKSRK